MSIGNGVPYNASGFRLDGSVEEGDIVWYLQDAVNITSGDAIFATATGITNVGTAFAATFLGVAAFTQANSVAGSVKMGVIKPNPNKFFWAPVGSAVLVTVAAVGTKVDLKSNHSVDITDTTLVSWGFEVIDYDASTLAVAANAAGFVKGKFMPQPQ